MRVSKLRRLAAVLVVAGAWTCSDSGGDPPSRQVPAAIAIVSGDGQRAVVGSTLLEPVVVRVSDASGAPLAGVRVEFQVSSGGGHTGTSVEVSDASGRVSETWTLGTSAVTLQSLTAYVIDSTTGEHLVSTSASATGTAAAAAHLDVKSGNRQSAPGGTQLTENLVVAVSDQYGNPVAGVPVAWTVDAGGGTVTPASGSSGADGLARGAWRLGAAGAPQRVLARTEFAQEAFSATATGQAVLRVFLSTHTVALIVGGTAQLFGRAVDQEGTDIARPLAWQSTAPGVANVSTSGLVTAASPGTALVIVTLDGVSDTAGVTVSVAPPQVPSTAPASVAAQSDATAGTVRITWQFSGSDATYYQVTRVETAGGTSGTQAFTATPSAGGLVYTDAQISADVTHTFEYRVAACNAAGCGPASGVAIATVPRLEPPTNLTATVAVGGGVTLAWRDNSGNETGFEIYQRSLAGVFGSTPLAALAENTTSYQTSLPTGTSAVFVVRAVLPPRAIVGANRSIASNEVTVSVPASGSGQLPTVQTLEAVAVSNHGVALDSRVTPNGTSTLAWFEYGTDPALATPASTPVQAIGSGTVPAGPTATIGSLTTGVTYYFRAAASNAAGIARGAILSFSTAPPPDAPLALSAQVAKGTVALTWQKPTGGLTQYYEIRRIEGATTSLLRRTQPSTSFSDVIADASIAHSFTYQVLACNDVGCGPAASVNVAVPRLEPPTNLAGTVGANGGATLTWRDNSAEEDGYLLVGTGTQGESIVSQVLGANATTFTTAPLAAGVTVTFRVMAFYGTGTPQDRFSLSSNTLALTATGAAGSTPTVQTLDPIAVSSGAAIVDMRVTPNGSPTLAWYEWGTDPTLATSTKTSSVDVGSGTVPAASQVTLMPAAANTTHYYRAAASNSAGVARGAILSFTTAPPSSAPLSLQAQSAKGVVTLTWQRPTSGITEYYRIRRTENAVTTTLRNVNVPTSFTDTFTDVTAPHAITYAVAACNDAGCGPDASASLTVPRLEPPTGLTGAATVGTARLTWNDNSADEDGFQVVGTGTQGEIVFDQSVAANTTALDVSVPAGVTITFSARAFYGTSGATKRYSLSSNNASVTGAGSGGAAPTVTTLDVIGVSATGVRVDGRVNPNGQPTLMWIEYGTSPTLATSTSTPTVNAGSGTVPVSAETVIGSLTPNTTYYYRVAASNSGGAARGAILSFATAPPSAPPSNLQAQSAKAVVTLTWQRPAAGTTQYYRVRRTENGTTTTLINVNVPASFTNTITDVTTSHAFTYAVAACNDSGCGPDATVQITVPRLEPPTGLAGSVSAGGSATLTWQDKSADEDGFRLIGTGPQGEQIVNTVFAANTTSATLTLPAGVSVMFTVRAYYGTGTPQDRFSLPSNTVTLTNPGTGPAKP